MDETPPHEDNTNRREDNTTDNTAAPQGPENAESTPEAGDHTDFSILLQILLAGFDSQDALTRRTNETRQLRHVAGNSCYMWRSSDSCFNAKDDLQLWHQKLGHMNIRNLTTLVKNEVIRGIPKLKDDGKLRVDHATWVNM